MSTVRLVGGSGMIVMIMVMVMVMYEGGNRDRAFGFYKHISYPHYTVN